MRSRRPRKRTRVPQEEPQEILAPESQEFQAPEEEAYEDIPAPEETAAYSPPPASPKGNAWVLLVPGILLLGGGILLSAAGPSLAGLPPALAGAGPFAALAGLFFLALAPLFSRIHKALHRLADLEEATEFLKEQDKAIRTSLADLNSIDVAAKLAQVASGMAPSEIKEALTRADEKISNLTKATRMFSQPLEELSKAVADVSERLEKAEGSLREVLGTSQTSAARLEEFAATLPTRTAAEAGGVFASRIEETLGEALQAAGREWGEKISALGEDLQAAGREWGEKIGALGEDLGKLKENLEAFKGRVEEDLLELHEVVSEASKGGAGELEQSLTSVEARISQALEEKTSHVQAKVEELRTELEGVRSKLEELGSAPGTQGPGEDPAVSQVLQILQGLERKVQDLTSGLPAGTQAPAPQPVHAGTAPSSMGEASAPPPPPPAPPKKSSPGGGSVLSAIQKLKAMRGNG